MFISVEITAALKLLWPVYYTVLNLDQYSCYDSVHGCTGCHSSEHSMEWRKLLYERWRSYFDLLRDLELQIRITFHLKHKSECKWYLWSWWKCALIDDCKYNIIVIMQYGYSNTALKFNRRRYFFIPWCAESIIPTEEFTPTSNYLLIVIWVIE